MKQDVKIYLKLDKKPKNVAEILQLFWGTFGSVETFHDKECTKIQCEKNKGRSFDDLYYCCKTYFPNVTPKKVFHELVIYNLNNKIFYSGTCSTIGKIKINFTEYKTLKGVWINIYEKSISYSKYNSIWSWKELFKMLNIKNDEELTKYREKYNVKL
jgi:hypothetical protein